MTLLVKGVRVNLLREGRGQPVLFLHGNPDSSTLWQPVIAGLCSQFHCLAPDLPGFGHSIAPRQFDYSLINMAGFIEQLLDALHIDEPVALVGHDIGAMYGLAFAVRNRARVSRIVLTNTAFSEDFQWHRWAHVWRTPVLGELSMVLASRALFTHELRRGSMNLSAAHMRKTWELITPAMRSNILRAYRALRPANFRGWESRMHTVTAQVPTMVLWGREDPYIPAQFAQRFGAEQTHYHDHSGHWLPAEQPAFFLQHTAAFLSA